MPLFNGARALADSTHYDCAVTESGTDFPEPAPRRRRGEISVTPPFLDFFGGPRIKVYLSGRNEGLPPAVIPVESLYDSPENPGFKEFVVRETSNLMGSESSVYSFDQGILGEEASGKAHVSKVVSSTGSMMSMDFDMDCSRR